jgi:DNA-binding NarL/FixJ family response regulator
MSIRLIIVDDHPVFRFGLRTLIAAEPDMAIVGEASNGTEALELVAVHAPDVVLLDVNLPDINGVEATRHLLRLCPSLRILMITMFDDDTVFGALKAGAGGYILKGASAEETARAIRVVANGEAIFSPSIARRMVQHFDALPRPAPFPDLTEREQEILRLLAQGLTNSAIAERLGLSIKTVRNRVSDIFAKLEVADRAEAIIKARDAGLGSS